MDNSVHRISTPQLFVEVAGHAADLVQSELRLARNEAREIAENATRLIAGFAIAGAFMAAAVFFLLEALVDWLVVMHVRSDHADLAVGLSAALIAIALFYMSWRASRSSAFSAGRTFRQLRKDVGAVRDIGAAKEPLP